MIRSIFIVPFLLLCTPPASAFDQAWFTEDAKWMDPTHAGVDYVTSKHITMRDGVGIAVDLYLPKDLRENERVPTLLWITRYMRSVQLRRPWRWFLGNRPYDHTGRYGKIRDWFVTHGYAWMDVDVRGTGASSGHQTCPYCPDETRDYAEVVDWVVKQPWSNAKVGALGVSYAGSTAEFLLVNHHPAVRAIAPLFSGFDSYTDIAFPGGIHATRFTEDWQHMNDALDHNAPHEVAGQWVRLFVTGVSPVRGDDDGQLLASAMKEHELNFKVHEGCTTNV